MNSRLLLVLLLLSGVVLAALVARNGNVLMVAIPFLVYLLAGTLEIPARPELKVIRTLDRMEMDAGEPVSVRILVENHGARLVNLCISDGPPPGMTVAGGHSQQRLALEAGEAVHLEYAASAKRGIYAWEAVSAVASDPFGLFEARCDLAAPAEVRVRAAPMRLRDVPIRPRLTLHAPGPTPARRAGPGTDFWGIREYRSGDPLRRLNWRLAGRYPRRLFTNDYEGAEVADIGLIIDTRRLSNAWDVEEALFESRISAAASLSEMFIDKGDRVALLVFGQSVACLFPGSGKKQLNRIKRQLARARLGPNYPLRYLEYFPARVFPSRSVILAFSALDPRDTETYARLRRSGYEVLLISPNPVDWHARTLPPDSVSALAVRAARVERAVLLKKLLKTGVGVIDWQIDQPLDGILQGTARTLAHRRNM